MIASMLLVAGLGCADLPGMNEDFDSETIDRGALAALVEAESPCAEALAVQGRLHMQAGETDAGVETFEQLVETHGERSMSHAWLGRALLSRASRDSSLSDAKSAVRSLEKAIKLDPMNFEARETLASFHRNAPWIAGGDMDVAEEQAEFIMQHDRRRGIGVVVSNLVADGDEDEAIELMQATLVEHPEWDDIAVQLAVAWHEEKEFAKAHDLLADYAAKPEPLPMAVYQLGRTAALSGQFIDDGRRAMQRYIAMVEVDDSLGVPATSAYWRLGNIEEHAGDIEAARAAYRKAVELEPENEVARKALADLD
ncbi:MAG: tetratricopeptide repeat protein [Gammaproteobacteria bacterium]|nr:tetratricopeptide repeat protein [Gammaproteobacteria bacterium]